MAEPLFFGAPEGEPLSILESTPEGVPTLPAAVPRRLEFSCRGDRVPLDVLTPGTDPPYPILLFQPAPAEPGGPASLRGLRTWLGAGIAVASVELPLFGSRRSAKLSEKLNESIVTAARGDAVDETAALLWEEFTRQAVMELRRALDVLAASWDAPPTPTVFAGVGIAALVGALFCAADDRPRGALLALAGAGFGPESIDPAGFVGGIAPRPVLFVNQEGAKARPGAPAIPKERAIELHEAAGEGSDVVWQGPDATDVLEPAWSFLSPLLGKG